MIVPDLDALVAKIVGVLQSEPDRDFSTTDIATLTSIDVKFLVALACYLSPYAKRGAPRLGTGYMARTMVRPWIWSIPHEVREQAATVPATARE